MSGRKLDKKKLFKVYLKTVFQISFILISMYSILSLINNDYTILLEVSLKTILVSFVIVFIVILNDFIIYKHNKDDAIFSRLYKDSVFEDDKGDK